MKNGWTSKTRMVGFAFYSQIVVLVGAALLAHFDGPQVLTNLESLIIAFFASMTAVVGAHLHYTPPNLNQGMSSYGGYNSGFNNYSRPITPTQNPHITKAVDNPD